MARAMTTSEAASQLKISRARVLQLIRAGRLPARRFGRSWLILSNHVEGHQRGKPGRKAQVVPPAGDAEWDDAS